MVEVEITNFQSIAHATMVIDGFTTVVGRNWIGKSAVMRAINAALVNKQGTDFIRWGEKYCEVRLKSPYIDILWHKEEGKNFYIVNGSRYEKIGRDEPPAPIKDAGLGNIIVGDQKINLGYVVQFFPLFLVDKQDSKSADLLASVYGLNRLYKALDLCVGDQKSTVDELKVREKDLEIASRDLERFQEWDSIEAHTKAIVASWASLSTSEALINKMIVWYTTVLALSSDMKRLKDLTEVRVPSSEDLRGSVSSLKGMQRYLEDLTTLSEDVSLLGHRASATVPDQGLLHTSVTDLSRHQVLLKRHTILNQEIDTLEAKSSVLIPDAGALKENCETYQKLRTWHTQALAISKEVVALRDCATVKIDKPTIDTEGLSKMRILIETQDKLNLEVSALATKLYAVEAEEKTYKIQLDAFNVCPLCKKPRV